MFIRQFPLKIQLLREQFKRHLFSNLFVLALTVSIVLGSAGSVYPRLSAPSQKDTCQQIPQDMCEEVRQLARDDVEDGITRRTPYAIDQYKELHPQWKTDSARVKIKIGWIYDKEYTKQTKAKQRDPREALKELLNWDKGLFVFIILLFGSVLGVFLKDTLTQGVTNFFKTIDNWVYARYAGSRLFQNIALGRYRTALVEKYKHLHIPFRTNRPPLDMSKVYIPLKAAGSSRSEQIDAHKSIAKHHRLMVTGPPGSGKSMLLKHLALSYGKWQLVGLPERTVPVLLELHRLSDPALTPEKLIQALVDAFDRNNFPGGGRFVQQSLHQGTLMLLLDGLDEINSAMRPSVVGLIRDLLDRYDRCRVIITCRTAVYRGEFDNVTNQTLEVVEFNDQQVRQFLGT